MKKLCCILVSLCMLMSLLPMTVVAEEETASKIQPTLQEKLDNCKEGDLISTYVWFEPLSPYAIARVEGKILNEENKAYREKREVSDDVIREILANEGFSEYADTIIERIEQRIKEIDETVSDKQEAENRKMYCHSSIASSYLEYYVLEPISAQLAEEWGISEYRVLIYGSPFSVIAMNLTPAEIETIAQSELSTKLDWYSGDIFDYSAHAHDYIAAASCMCGAHGGPGSHPGINCSHLITSVGTTFKWLGEQERMADFENDPEKVPDCFSPFVTPLSKAVLFLEGVPNLGDYLFFYERNVEKVYIPDSVKEIGEHTFSRFTDVTFYCHPGSYAEEFAKSHNIECILLGTKEAYFPEFVYGDATGDRERNLKDVLALRKAMGQGTASELPAGADCNGDGEVNMKDVLMLRQHLAGLFV